LKILFFISVHGHGRGGHFHSLNHIAKEIGKKHQVKIISIGSGRSEVIKENLHFLGHLNFYGLNFTATKQKITRIFKEFNPDVLHFFDVDSYNAIRLLANIKKTKVAVNKCGGPNPTVYPYVKNLILFSQENFDWFKIKKKFQDSNIALIANRVIPIVIDPSFQPIMKARNKFTFLRICRIGLTYKKSIKDSIRLIESLNFMGIYNVKLIVIGTVENWEVYKELANLIENQNVEIEFITDPNLTREASKMLYLADAVIGTGRGFMEAASLGVPLLTINGNGDLPVVVDEENYCEAFKTNFSERNVFKLHDDNKNIEKIKKIIFEKNFYNEMSLFSKKIFNRDFDITLVSNKYLKFYDTILLDKKSVLTDLFNILRYTIKDFLLSSIKNKQG
jgi:glycosyltransferase involved in cell wall biosynthesis